MMHTSICLWILPAIVALAGCTEIDQGDLAGDLEADAGLLPAADANVDDPEETPPTPLAVIGQTRGTGHVLRAEPNAESEALVYMPDYATVEIRGEKEGKWWPLRYKNKEGWAHQNKLTVHQDGDVPPAPEGFNFHLPFKDGKTFKVSGDHSSHNNPLTTFAWDFSMPVGTPLHASHSGVVRKLKKGSTRGGCSTSYLYDANYVIIDRGDGLETNYVHLQSVAVEVGDVVKRGDFIGKSGQTGYSCGAHLHFHIQKSPDWGGSSTAQSNQSVKAYFWDKGWRFNPKFPQYVTSHGTTSEIP